MPEAPNQTPALNRGKNYHSTFDAAWGGLLQKAGKMARYRETGFALPDGTVFTPELAIRSLGRYVTIAGNVVRPRVCQALNVIARNQGRPTALVKGHTDSATIIFFDGQEPTPGWEHTTDPAPHFTSTIVETHSAEEALSVLLRPEPTQPHDFTLPRVLRDLPTPARPEFEALPLSEPATPPHIVVI